MPFERFKAIDKYKDGVSKLFETSVRGESSIEKRNSIILPAAAEQITAEEMNKTLDNIKSSLGEGGIGVGVPIGYLPKSNPTGLYKVFQLACELNVLVFTHVRNPDIISIQEVIAAAALTNAPLHIVHINSMALGNIQLGLYMVNAAQKRGIDITAELYPYTVGSTSITSAMFNDRWQEKLGISYGDVQSVATGERLAKETFEVYRKTGGTVILHAMKPEWIKTGIAVPDITEVLCPSKKFHPSPYLPPPQTSNKIPKLPLLTHK